MIADWLAPVLIVVSVLLLARAFYILYVQQRGSRTTTIITWLSAAFIIGFWTWRLILVLPLAA